MDCRPCGYLCDVEKCSHQPLHVLIAKRGTYPDSNTGGTRQLFTGDVVLFEPYYALKFIDQGRAELYAGKS